MKVLPESLRPYLQKPLGPVLDEKEAIRRARSSRSVVSVGDVVTRTLLEHGVLPHLMIVDGHSERKKIEEIPPALLGRAGVREVRVANAPATLSDDLIQAVQESLERTGPTLLRVEGEEDLATLPVLLHFPPGTSVFYGQPGEGIVHLVVDEENRRRAKEIVDRMVSR